MPVRMLYSDQHILSVTRAEYCINAPYYEPEQDKTSPSEAAFSVRFASTRLRRRSWLKRMREPVLCSDLVHDVHRLEKPHQGKTRQVKAGQCTAGRGKAHMHATGEMAQQWRRPESTDCKPWDISCPWRQTTFAWRQTSLCYAMLCYSII